MNVVQRYLGTQGLTLAEWCIHFVAGFAAGGIIVAIINLIHLAYRSIVS